MGCDIHLFAEVRREGKWKFVSKAPSGSVDPDPIPDYGDQFYSGRNYELFALLANVRNYNDSVKPLSEPRGVPIDISSPMAKAIESWSGDGHSHSHFTLNELMTFAYGENWIVDRNRNKLSEILSRSQQFSETLDKLCEFLTQPGMTPDDIRIVFFFDN